LGQLDIDGWAIVWSAIVLVITYLLARYAGRAVLRLGERVAGVRGDLVQRAARGVRYAIYLLGAGVVLSILGAPIKPVLIALLLMIGALILVGRGIADNFGAGLVLQFRHAVELGDVIETGDHRGRVVELNSRAVVLEAIDGTTVHVPNTQLVDNALVNVSARNLACSTIEVRIHLDASLRRPDAAATAELLTDALSVVSGLREDPAPSSVLVSAGVEDLVFHLQIWHAPGAAARVCSDATYVLDQTVVAHDLRARTSWPPPPVAANPLGL
jgi:small-conductance mechanosensitive channel